MDRIDAYLEGVNLTLPYEDEYAAALSQLSCITLTHLFDEIQSAVDNGLLPYPVELVETYDHETVVAFDEENNLIKYVLHNEENLHDLGEYRWHAWVSIYVVRDNAWTLMSYNDYE